MIDHFASQDIEREGEGETLAGWLARTLGETPTQARARLAQMERVCSEMASEQPERLRRVA